MRNRKLILVLDVESTCWQGDPPQGQISEIIEIGVTPVYFTDTGYEIGQSESILVKPLRSYVSAFCTHLTGWTQADVDTGMLFRDAVAELRKKFDTKNCIFASWGKYDDKMFQKMCEVYDVRYPFNNDHLNVKALWGAKYGSVRGVGDAVAFLGWEFEGRPHKGIDDTRNIAKLLVHLLS